jgi:hypothetical protein
MKILFPTKSFLLLAFMFAFSYSSYAQKEPITWNAYKAPDPYIIIDTASGDFNNDNFRDFIVVLNKPGDFSFDDTIRPLVILMGSPEGPVFFARNDYAALCASCGGVFGDPYQGISIKGKFFSIDEYGGSNWRWTRNTTFRYDNKTKSFILHKDGGYSYHTSDPDKTKDYYSYKKYWGKMKFEAYNYNRDE